MPAAEPYLLVDGTEAMNSLRTFTYLRRGLGSPDIAVITASPLVAAERGYRDAYVDYYEADPYWPGNLACFCSLFDFGPYVSPAADPAPWYDSSRPESADFLGLVGAIDLPAVGRRSVSARSGGGASIGRLRLGPRIVQLDAIMYGATTAAMAFGEAWLRQLLAGEATGCGEGTATLLPACPPDDAGDPDDYLRELIEVGIADGPVFGAIDRVGSCFAQTVAFQLAAGSPYLRHLATDCIGIANLNIDPTLCCSMQSPALLGDAAARITIHAGQVGSSVTDIEITATRDTSCPSSAAADATYTVDRIPRGCALVIDSSTRSVTVTNTLTGEVVGGADALDLSGIVPWVVAEPGQEFCICVDASAADLNPGTLALVERIGREL